MADAYVITEIVMIFPGRAAASVRKQAASVLVRYLGGLQTGFDDRQSYMSHVLGVFVQ